MRSLQLIALLFGLLLLATSFAKAEEFQEDDEEDEQEQLDDEQEEEEEQPEEEQEEDEMEERLIPCFGTVEASTVIGGQTIVATLKKMYIGSKCTLVQQGSTLDRYTLAAPSCATCWKSGGGYACNGASLANKPGCELSLGPDCRLYPHAIGDKEAACTAA